MIWCTITPALTNRSLIGVIIALCEIILNWLIR